MSMCQLQFFWESVALLMFYSIFFPSCLCHTSSSLKVRSNINLHDWQEEGTSEVLHGLKFL